ncbi:two component transcriptional regulator, LuxR family (plasmid) [Stanieria cyanosphaera PCC 7437]|uniref:Two component transcriptional regulator, LuxR family n=1 Tax=Stanieria cyanosphaera (strain ATCC 29371 / PCC 7437) TaxID=111780 RepID=K9Y280_STAC7|nr:response regulator transcription factor [Stanieria cyanosphaera]AFZ38082.1 two component transcriptional regulator, LuxR family [Stanieria cyanosphaera PCC 7437]
MNETKTQSAIAYEFKLPSATVLLIKKDPFQRLGLCKILAKQESLTIYDCADSFKGLRLAQRYQPDIIILDLEILVSSNFKLYEQLIEQSPKAQLIVCGQKIDRETILKVYSISASYYFEDGDISKLLLAIASTFEGSIYVHPLTSHLLSNNLLMPVSSLGLDSLAPKELTALKHLITGKDYQEIGQTMCISSHTVRNYICGIVKKLGLKNRTQAVVVAVCGGLLAEIQ